MSGPVEVGDDNEYFNYTDARWQNSQKCVLFKDPKYRDVSVNMCKPVCQDALDEAKEEGRTSNCLRSKLFTVVLNSRKRGL